MYSLYFADIDQNAKACARTYRNIFKSMNLSFHKPKKDQCSLCINYREGGEDKKKLLEETYLKHIKEKEKVRELKTHCKLESSQCEDHTSAVFHLQ